MEFNHLLVRVHYRMLTNIFQDLSFCCLIIQTVVKIGRANHPTSLLFSRYLYSQSSYFQGATHSDLSNYCLGQLISDCTNRSSSTFLRCYLQLLLDLPEVISGVTKYLPDDHRCGVLPRYTLVGYSPKPADLNNQSSYLSILKGLTILESCKLVHHNFPCENLLYCNEVTFNPPLVFTLELI